MTSTLLQNSGSATEEHLPMAPSIGYFVTYYMRILVAAVKRTTATQEDLSGLLFMLSAPFLYLLGLKLVKSPVGLLYVENRETIRSFTYGFFKTQFFYLKALKTLLRESRFPVVVDVGANLGDFTLGIANAADKIVAVEPSKRNFQALEANIRANNLSNVVSVNVAATEDEGDVYLQGNASDMFVAEENEGERTKGMPLDIITEVNGIENVDVLKVDAQGHELSVLFGTHQLFLKKAIKLLIVEVHLKRGIQVEEVISFMDGYDYQLIHNDSYLFDQPHLYFAYQRNFDTA
jgi:FkbM family methyltransferase